MSSKPRTQAVLLLTAYLGKPSTSDPRPLSPTEWGRFEVWLKDRALSPESLLQEAPEEVLTDCTDAAITLDRVRFLLDRAGALGLALERWERAGLWVATHYDADYPERLRSKLKTDSPPVLFGCGQRSLLNQRAIAVVGSRDAGQEDLAFATRLGAEAALQGFSVVSGGARGVDEAAMMGALEREGSAVGVLADNLLRTATSSKYRKALMARNLVLVSSFYPEVGFDVGNAMARNKYIYCLSRAAVVVSCTNGKGGTWNGAIENLRKNRVPLWVKDSSVKESGNQTLVARGAKRLPEGQVQLSALAAEEPTALELFDVGASPEGQASRLADVGPDEDNK